MSCTEFSVVPVLDKMAKYGLAENGWGNIHLLILIYCCVHVHLQSFLKHFYESHIASVHECFSSFNTKKIQDLYRTECECLFFCWNRVYQEQADIQNM